MIVVAALVLSADAVAGVEPDEQILERLGSSDFTTREAFTQQLLVDREISEGMAASSYEAATRPKHSATAWSKSSATGC